MIVTVRSIHDNNQQAQWLYTFTELVNQVVSRQGFAHPVSSFGHHHPDKIFVVDHSGTR